MVYCFQMASSQPSGPQGATLFLCGSMWEILLRQRYACQADVSNSIVHGITGVHLLLGHGSASTTWPEAKEWLVLCIYESGSFESRCVLWSWVDHLDLPCYYRQPLSKCIIGCLCETALGDAQDTKWYGLIETHFWLQPILAIQSGDSDSLRGPHQVRT